MRTRIISGALLLAGVAVIAAVRGLLLDAAVLAAVVIAAREFYAMAEAGGHRPWRVGGLLLAVALVIPALLMSARAWIEALPGLNPGQLWLFGAGAQPGLLEGTTLVLVGAGLPAALVWRGTHGVADTPGTLAPWTDVGLTIAGALYTGGILKYALLLDRKPGELWWLLLVILGTAAADSGAYFAGRAWGRSKLIPHISPNKTWAGFWGGLLSCVLAVVLFAWPMHIPAWHIPLLGAAIGLSSVLGDLCESLLKRSFGVKDSSTLIPGHGGLLDRLDSILFVLLVVYAYMRIVA